MFVTENVKFALSTVVTVVNESLHVLLFNDARPWELKIDCRFADMGLKNVSFSRIVRGEGSAGSLAFPLSLTLGAGWGFEGSLDLFKI